MGFLKSVASFAVPLIVSKGDMLFKSAQCLGGVENSSLHSMVEVCTIAKVDAQLFNSVFFI